MKARIKHKAKVLSKKEVEEGRSSAYEYLDFDTVSKPKFKSIRTKCKIKAITRLNTLISVEDLDPEFSDIVTKNFWNLI